MPATRLIVVLLLGTLALAGCGKSVADFPVAATAAIEPATNSETAPISGPITIKWEELDVGIQAESVFEPWMMKTSIKSLDGQQVRITGYMHGGVPVKEGIREFVLLRNLDCPYGRQGEAHHVILVTMHEEARTSYTSGALTVEGTFHIRPFEGPDGSTWALYAIDHARVSIAAVPPPTDSIHTLLDEANR